MTRRSVTLTALILAIAAAFVCAALHHALAASDPAAAPAAPVGFGMLFAAPTLYSSRALRRIEPLLHFALESEDGASLAGFDQSDSWENNEAREMIRKRRQERVTRLTQLQWHPSTNLPAAPSLSVFPSTPYRSSPSGRVQQPYPDRLRVSLRVPRRDDSSFPAVHRSAQESSSLHAHQRAFEGVLLEITERLDDVDDSTPRFLTTYRGTIGREHLRPLPSVGSVSGSVVLTLHADGRFQATLTCLLGDTGEEETWQIDPVEHHLRSMRSPADFEALARATFQPTVLSRLEGEASSSSSRLFAAGAHGMTVFRYSDLIVNEDSGSDEAPPAPISSAARRLLAVAASASASSPSLQAPWSNCYPGSSSPHRLSLGIAVDQSFLAALGGEVGRVQQSVAQMIAQANAVLSAAAHLQIVWTDFTVLDSTTSGNLAAEFSALNESPSVADGSCATLLYDKLTVLAQWRQKVKPSRNALWHLMTACDFSGGSSGSSAQRGIAFRSSACSSRGVSISARSSGPVDQIATFLHEIAHNLGASHAPSGVMAVGAGARRGRQQQHSGLWFDEANRAEMCTFLSGLVRGGSTSADPYCMVPVPTSSSSSGPRCGNGIVEGTEACDDASPCCDQASCSLKGEAQCSGDSACCDPSTCKFKLSTTLCGEKNQGYCSNGRCQPSTCVASLSLCAVSVDAPCKQSCKLATKANSTCTSSYIVPSTDVLDGSLCALSPHSMCRSGVCTSTTAGLAGLTYSWELSDWTACACTGSQTRSTSCVASDGSAATASQCAGPPPGALSQSCAVPSSCYSFAWELGTWSACSRACNTGVQTAPAQCVSSSPAGSKTVVVASLCTATRRATTRICNTAPCVTAWATSEWSSCSKSCGNGIQTRHLSCKQTLEGKHLDVPASMCTAAAPASAQPCNTPSCPQYSLRYGPWSSCSASCGSEGVQTRQAWCIASGSTAPVDLAKCGCGSSGGCAATTQKCNTAVACPQPPSSFSWSTGAWGACSVSSCGGGTQTRAVSCQDAAGVTQPDYACSTMKPPSLQDCLTAPCPTYAWMARSYGACGASCGGGTQTREVVCQATQGDVITEVAASLCTAASQPASSQSCNTLACTNVTPTYWWFIGDWSSCTGRTRRGTQTREVHCAQTGSFTRVASLLCASLGTAPANSRSCYTTERSSAAAAESQYSWDASEWGSCSRACSGGTRVRSVRCVDASDNEVDAALCDPSSKPESSSECMTPKCPAFWHTSEWSSCSAPCNGGTQTRTVQCQSVNRGLRGDSVETLSDGNCTGSKPSLIASCNVYACPSWQTTEWSACNAPCGDGTKYRNATCVNDRGERRPDQECSGSNLPALAQVCRAPRPCGFWHISANASWTSCSRLCGGGNQTREVLCVLPSELANAEGEQAICLGEPPSFSDAVLDSTAPPMMRACNEDPCPETYWDVRDFSVCDAACGGGTRTGRAVCIRSSDDTEVAASACIGEPPSGSAIVAPCNPHPCPDYQWSAPSAWSACDVECGTGRQTREVSCVDAAVSSPTSPVHVDPELCVSGASNVRPEPEQKCFISPAVCFGAVGAVDDFLSGSRQANGRCVHGRCLCRGGFGSRNCTDTPRIFQVHTSMDPPASSTVAPAPLAMGDKIQIRWESSGSLDRVSVLAVSADANGQGQGQVAQYLATDLANTGSFLWHIGSGGFVASPGLDGAPRSYRFVVWFSPTIQATGKVEFTFSDPCAYRSCGLFGVCRIGAANATSLSASSALVPNRADAQPTRCECLGNWSGENCDVGPCAAMGCAPETSACDDTASSFPLDSATGSACNCTHGFTGSQCRTPSGSSCAAAATCLNGGDLAGVIARKDSSGAVAVDACGSCACTQQWGGADCDSCTLSCLNGGQPSADCARCECDAASGFFGSRCECRFYLLTVSVALSLSADELAFVYFSDNDAASLARATLATTLRADFIMIAVAATAGSQDASIAEPLAVDVVGFSSTNRPCAASSSKDACALIDVNLRLSFECHEVLLSSVAPRVHAQRKLGQAVVSSSPLLTAYNAFAAQFSDLDSPVYRGALTSRLNRSAVLKVVDPSGLDSPQPPSDPVDPFKPDAASLTPDGSPPGGNGNSDDSSLGDRGRLPQLVVVGLICGTGGCVMMMASLVLVLLRRRQKRKAKKIEQKLQRLQELGIRASSPAAIATGAQPQQQQQQQFKLRTNAGINQISVAPSRQHQPSPPHVHAIQLQPLPVHTPVPAAWNPSPSPPPAAAGPRYLNPYLMASPEPLPLSPPPPPSPSPPLDSSPEPSVHPPAAEDGDDATPPPPPPFPFADHPAGDPSFSISPAGSNDSRSTAGRNPLSTRSNAGAEHRIDQQIFSPRR